MERAPCPASWSEGFTSSPVLLAFALIATFWTSTVVSELFLGAAAVAAVKQAILWGMLLLIPAMAAVGGTRVPPRRQEQGAGDRQERRRMPVIALNGILVLVPSAFFLAARASAGQFDTAFYAVQAVELVAGAVNIALMSLNMRDGFAMTRKRRQQSRAARRALRSVPHGGHAVVLGLRPGNGAQHATPARPSMICSFTSVGRPSTARSKAAIASLEGEGLRDQRLEVDPARGHQRDGAVVLVRVAEHRLDA